MFLFLCTFQLFVLFSFVQVLLYKYLRDEKKTLLIMLQHTSNYKRILQEKDKNINKMCQSYKMSKYKNLRSAVRDDYVGGSGISKEIPYLNHVLIERNCEEV
jgi:hypothetical protein